MSDTMTATRRPIVSEQTVPSLSCTTPDWHILRIRSQRWVEFLDDCRERDIEAYVPTMPHTVRKRMPNGRRIDLTSIQPAYVGYAFAPVDVVIAAEIRGHLGHVIIGGLPLRIRGRDVERIRRDEVRWHDEHDAQERARAPKAKLRLGDEVRITSGLFAGQVGTLTVDATGRHVAVMLAEPGAVFHFRRELVEAC